MRNLIFLLLLLTSIFLSTSCTNELSNVFKNDKELEFASAEYSDFIIQKASNETLKLMETAFPNSEKRIVSFKNGISLQQTKEGVYIYQGDIILDEEDVKNAEKYGTFFSNEIDTRAAIITSHTVPGKRWPSNTIKCFLDPNMTQNTKIAVREAMTHWTVNTKLTFTEVSKPQLNSINFFNGNGCYSWLGFKTGRGGEISIDASWGTRSNAIHEIGHALGLIHEHCRPCRNNQIVIDFNNIKSGWKSQYEKTDAVELGMQVDYNSIMIYASYASSDIAIDPTRPVMQTTRGETWVRQTQLSPNDIALINSIY